MNRRGFFKRTIGALAAAVVAPHLLRPAHTTLNIGALTFRGRPLVFDKYCPSNSIYFLSPDGPYVMGAGAAKALWK